MKKTFTTIAFIALSTILACTKESGTVSSVPARHGGSGGNSAAGHYGIVSHTAARYSGSDYSQSISVDTANSMIQSYLGSVQYPSVDTALRSLSFDADTLRAYLQNQNIVTLKFMFAHQPAYKSAHNGEYSGMNPDAITMIVVGLNESDSYVLNNRNGVYEHFSPCPYSCQVNNGPYIQ